MSGILSQLGFCEELQNNTPAITVVTPSAGPPTIFTLTFGSAHGLLAGDTLVLSGMTPGTYNGTWTVYQVPSSTTLTVVTVSQLAANTVIGTYVAGIYGRGGTPSRFYDITPPESMKLQTPRIESAGLRASNKVLKSDKWAINRTGASGAIKLEVQAKQFGLLLKHLMGTIVTTGPADSAYTHTATIGAMLGKSLLMQIGKAFTQSQVVQPMTYPGVKVIDWTLSCAVDGILTLDLTLDAQDEQVSVVLAAASYPTSSELLTYAGGLVQVGGAEFDVTDFSLKCTMGYNADRRFLRQNTLQKEPAEAAIRDFDFTMTGEWTDMLQYNRFAASVRANAVAALSAAWTAPILIGATSVPSLTITAPAARFDTDSPVITGPELIPLPLSGKLLNTPGGTNDACTIAYVTADSTP